MGLLLAVTTALVTTFIVERMEVLSLYLLAVTLAYYAAFRQPVGTRHCLESATFGSLLLARFTAGVCALY